MATDEFNTTLYGEALSTWSNVVYNGYNASGSLYDANFCLSGDDDTPICSLNPS
jgi:hypothetical protein